ncbi:GntR family transcriptional regulator [Streptomyces albipurpureus]|uniref:GntR family transcriptional regulator n=1 Tax=Streptomyces albipurpureus TaxID=2897419 RepID=A0ABT0V1A3_9ACTN|nr:GntR family transcriptional regulator [Streptomyces sp. CWNU-1]MCM2393353.1 GntR family transcriptional regulator [Streptomyces sp. CWNU-1]
MTTLKYEQIADSLRQRIADGEFPPGAVLPSGRDLCEQWGVSRATAIKAYETLRNDGLLVAKQGQGFRVTETPLARPAGNRRSGSSRLAGGRPFRRLGTPTMEQPPDHVARRLHLASHVEALRRDRLVLLNDGTPMTLVSAWFPAEVATACPRLAQNGPIAEGTTRYVARLTGRTPVRALDVMSVRLATTAEAQLFAEEVPLAVAIDIHTAYDDADRPLVVEEGVTPAQHWERTDNYPMG